MSEQFTAALDGASTAYTRYADRLDLVEGCTLFTAESILNTHVAVEAMKTSPRGCLGYSGIAGHISEIDKREARKSYF